MSCIGSVVIAIIITAVAVVCWIAWATFFNKPEYSDDDLFEDLWEKDSEQRRKE